MLSADQELDRFLSRRAKIFRDAMQNVARSVAGPFFEQDKAVRDLADTIRRTVILADLNGRKRLWMEVDKAKASFDAEIILNRSPIAYGVAFEEAVDDIVKREPRVVPKEIPPAMRAEWVSSLYSQEEAFAAARSVSEKLTRRVQNAIERSIREGIHPDKTQQEIMEIAIEESHSWTAAYAQTVYRTNVTRAYTQGRFEQAKDEDVRAVTPAMEFVARMDDATRPNHAAAHGLIADSRDAVWEQVKPPLGYNCFLPGTLVSGRFSGGLKARYSGPAIEIEAEDGSRLSVTANHPVFTTLGWRRADNLKEGDYLLSGNKHIQSFFFDANTVPHADNRRAVNNQNMPARIEDVFNALRSDRARPRQTLSGPLPLDFYGDAKWFDGNIDIVGSDWKLVGDATKDFDKAARQLPLELAGVSSSSANASGNAGSLVNSSLAATGGGPSGGTLGLDDRTVIAAPFSVSPFQSLRLGPASDWDATSAQEAKNRSMLDPLFLSQLLGTNAGQVATNKVVRVRRFEFVGHVYDLQSAGGWILSNNIITSNCRCSLILVTVHELERRGLIRDGRVVRNEPSGFEEAGPDGPPFTPTVQF